MRILLLVLLIGCKSVTRDARLTTLTDDDALALCEEFHRNERNLNCGGPAIPLPETDDQACADRLLDLPPSCAATARDFRECRRALRADDACEPTTDLLPECAWQYQDACFSLF